MSANPAWQPQPYLATKLYIPQVGPDYVSRPDLTARLDRAMQADTKLTLLSAPPGSGKTSLLSEWINHKTIPVAWVALDEADNDPVRLLAHVVTALRQLEVIRGEMLLDMLSAPQPPPLEVVLTGLINEAVASAARFALVLDDYHVIESDVVQHVISFLLDNQPPDMHLILSTRTDPPLSLARMRSRGQLVEIRGADLRFSSEQIQSFFAGLAGLTLSGADLATLEGRTEGWIAGLQLAALSLRGHADSGAFIASFAGDHRYVLDYLAEEVLNQQPDDIREFLLHTAILERLSGDLCDAVTGNGGGQAMLERLEEANLFIVPQDDRRQWYRYHQLFADFLRDRLQVFGPPDKVSVLHRRAADWFTQQDLAGEAVRHALAAQDYERAAGLIEQVGEEMLFRGEVATLQRWLDAMPVEMVRERPEMAGLHVYMLIVVLNPDWLNLLKERIVDAERGIGLEPGELLQALERKADFSPTAQLGMAKLAIARAFLARNFENDLPKAAQLAQAALEHMPDNQPYWRAMALLQLGVVQTMMGRSAEAEKSFALSAEVNEAAGRNYMAIVSRRLEAAMQHEMGRLREAIHTYQQTIDTGRAYIDTPLSFVGQAYTGLANVLLEQYELDTAMQHVTTGIELGTQDRDVDALLNGYSVKTYVLLAQGNIKEARAQTGYLEQVSSQYMLSVHMEQYYKALEAAIDLHAGDTDAASRWLAASGLTPDDEPTAVSWLEYEIVARTLIAQGNPQAALDLLNKMSANAEADGRSRDMLAALVVQVMAYHTLGNRETATRLLARALLLAEPEDFVWVFVREGHHMAALLRHAATRGHSPAFANRLLAAFGEIPEAAGGLPDPLSERELEVLQLVASGLTNSQIAAELVVAVSTVKSHVNRIYGKLSVSTRTEAVARARDLKLIS